MLFLLLAFEHITLILFIFTFAPPDTMVKASLTALIGASAAVHACSAPKANEASVKAVSGYEGWKDHVCTCFAPTSAACAVFVCIDLR